MTRPVLYDATVDLDCFAARLLLGALGVDYERVPVDVFRGIDATSRSHLAPSTHGALPILQLGTTSASGLADVLRVAATELDPQRRFLPPEAAGAIENWLAFATADLHVVVRARADALVGTGSEGPRAEDARSVLLVLEDGLTIRRLRGWQWFASAAPTLADLALYPAVALSRDFGLEHHEFPALRGWLRAVRALAPSVSMPGIPDPN